MAVYKQSPGPRGRVLWFRDGKMISKKDIPEDVLSTMELQKPVDDTKPEFRKCVFCGQPATEEKWLNGEKQYLCLDDYNTRTSGELAEKLRLSIVSPA